MSAEEGRVRRPGTNLPKMGDFNQSVILEVIRRSGDGLSRTELTDATGLSAQTVTNITRRLLTEGLVVEAGRTILGPGKPRTTLQLNAESRLAIGVHLDPAVITVVLLDLAGDVLAHRQRRTPAEDPHRIIDAMVEAIEEIITDTDTERSRIAGVGIATPGPLDIERGTVVDPPKLSGWHRVPLRDTLRERLGLDVLIEKDTTAATVAEKWMRERGHDSSFLFVYLGTGIGAGLCLSDEVVRGPSRNAGEIGHIMVETNGLPCWCGRRGCVAVTCTPQAILERAERAGVLADTRVGSDPESIDSRFTELCELAEQGHPAALDVIAHSAGQLATAVSVITNLLDIERVVFGGPFWSRLAPFYLTTMPELLLSQSDVSAVHGINVSSATAGDNVGAVGAGCVVLDAFYSPKASQLYLEG